MFNRGSSNRNPSHKNIQLVEVVQSYIKQNLKSVTDYTQQALYDDVFSPMLNVAPRKATQEDLIQTLQTFFRKNADHKQIVHGVLQTPATADDLLSVLLMLSVQPNNIDHWLGQSGIAFDHQNQKALIGTAAIAYFPAQDVQTLTQESALSPGRQSNYPKIHHLITQLLLSVGMNAQDITITKGSDGRYLIDVPAINKSFLISDRYGRKTTVMHYALRPLDHVLPQYSNHGIQRFPFFAKAVELEFNEQGEPDRESWIKQLRTAFTLTISQENLENFAKNMVAHERQDILPRSEKILASQQQRNQRRTQENPEKEQMLTIKRYNTVATLVQETINKSLDTMTAEDWNQLIDILVNKRIFGSEAKERITKRKTIGTTMAGGQKQANNLFAKVKNFNATTNQLPALWATMIAEFGGDVLFDGVKDIQNRKQVIEDRITKRVKDFEIELRTQETRLLMNKILQEEIDKSLETMTNQDWNKLIDSLIKKRILLSDVILRTKKRSPIATIMAGNQEQAKSFFGKGLEFQARTEQLPRLWSYMIAEFGGDVLFDGVKDIQNRKQVIEDHITKRVKDFETELKTQEKRLLMNKILQEEIDKSLETMTNEDWNKLIDVLVKKRILGCNYSKRESKRKTIGTMMVGSMEETKNLFAEGKQFVATTEQLPRLWAYMIEEFGGDVLFPGESDVKKRKQEILYYITKRVKDFEIEIKTQEKRLLMNKILQEEIDKSLETMTNEDWNKLIDVLVKKRIILGSRDGRSNNRGTIGTAMAGNLEQATNLFGKGSRFRTTIDQLPALWSYMIAEFGGDVLFPNQPDVSIRRKTLENTISNYPRIRTMNQVIKEVGITQDVTTMSKEDWRKLIDILVNNRILGSDEEKRTIKRRTIATTMAGSPEQATTLFGKGTRFAVTIVQLPALWATMIAEFGGQQLYPGQDVETVLKSVETLIEQRIVALKQKK